MNSNDSERDIKRAIERLDRIDDEDLLDIDELLERINPGDADETAGGGDA